MNENTQTKLYNMCGTCYKQLASPNLPTNMADQVIKNLVYLAKVLKLTSLTPKVQSRRRMGMRRLQMEREKLLSCGSLRECAVKLTMREHATPRSPSRGAVF